VITAPRHGDWVDRIGVQDVMAALIKQQAWPEALPGASAPGCAGR
jgi:hypothetical protein